MVQKKKDYVAQKRAPFESEMRSKALSSSKMKREPAIQPYVP